MLLNLFASISEFQELHSLLPHCFSELEVYCEKTQTEGSWVQAREILIIAHKTHTVIRNNSSLRCKKSSSLVLIRPILKKIMPFKNLKSY